MTKMNWDAHRFRKRSTPILTKEMIAGFKRDAEALARRIKRRNMTPAERAADASKKKQNTKRSRKRNFNARQVQKPLIQFVNKEKHWLFGVTK